MLALLVFAATYFHRQVGLIVLLCVGLFSAGIFQSNAVEADYYDRITFALSIILFFAAILLKRFLKKKRESIK